MGLKIFFDVDYTILAVDNSLRPGTRDTFEKLISDGHDVYIWSGVGLRNAEIRHHDLQDLVSGVYRKPIQKYVAGLLEFDDPHCATWFLINDELTQKIPTNFYVTKGSSGGGNHPTVVFKPLR